MNNNTQSQSTFDPRLDTPNRSSPDATSNDAANLSGNSNNSLDIPGLSSAAAAAAIDPALPRGPPLTDQDIVPQLLIDHYVSMVDPSRAQTVDSNIALHCAHSLPAVALTLGRSNWPLLKTTYECLATDMKWKVRSTLASSIHELGVILGEQSSSSDLIPIFNGFLKDLDEVRQGLLKHLADFIRLLGPADRNAYLPKLSDFLKMDNDRNWRFRQELTEQLERLLPLFSPNEVEEHICPIAMVLVHDKVASVRQSAADVIASILLAFKEAERPELAENLLQCTIDSLAHEELWVHRQTFATLSLQIYNVGALDIAEFATMLLPHLLDLSEDKVPNVRLAVARTLSSVNTSTDFLSSDENPYKERLQTMEKNLKNDIDVDVRCFYGGSAKIYGVHVPEEKEGNFLDDGREMTGDSSGEVVDLEVEDRDVEAGLLNEEEEEHLELSNTSVS